jgi:Icc protein
VQPFGQFPPPAMSLIHLSDTHLLAGKRSLFGVLETEQKLDTLFSRIHESALQPTAIVITGDLVDLGEPEAYDRLSDIVVPWADRIGAEVVWVMGNHDDREAFSERLIGVTAETTPQDRVYQWDGLRLIVLDTSVPGYHHGQLTGEQLRWLRTQLATAAPRGTLIAMHHPPLPSPEPLMGIIELGDQEDFWAAVADTDVRGVLAGHLHHASFSAHRGIPVSVVPGMCYTIDLVGPKDRLLLATDSGQSASVVTIHDDAVVFSQISSEKSPEVHGFSAEFLGDISKMTAQERIDFFSKKDSTFNTTQDRSPEPPAV